MKTANAYVDDAGDFEIVLDAANATALAGYYGGRLIAGTYKLGQVLKTGDITLTPKETIQEMVTGDSTAVALTSSKVPAGNKVGLLLLDDHFGGGTKEYGAVSSEFSSWELLDALKDSGVIPSVVKNSPKGINAGTVAVVLTDCKVTHVGMPGTNADSKQAARYPATIDFVGLGAQSINA